MKTDWYTNLVPPKDRRERQLWGLACMRVYRGAKRRRDKGLTEFAALWAYGTQLVKVS